jgi:5'-nucleotidase (lipoprotein e(P4) family)
MGKKIFYSSILFLGIVICSCYNYKRLDTNNNNNVEANPSEVLINSVLWVQNSAEYRALCYQSFNFARVAVERKLETIKNSEKPLAVVFDLDETLLDNSYYQAKLIQKQVAYNDDSFQWKSDWTLKGITPAIPGAIAFTNFLYDNGIAIVYISNREEDEKDITLLNMDHLGFPAVKPENVKFNSIKGPGSKSERRNEVMQRYNVILLVGDNMADLSDNYEGRIGIKGNNWSDNRFACVDSDKNRFGVDYIVIPGPMYGKWEQKDKMLALDSINMALDKTLERSH